MNCRPFLEALSLAVSNDITYKRCEVEKLYRFFGVYLSDYFKSGGSFVYFYFSYSKYLTVKEIAIIFVVIFRAGQ